MTPSQRKKLAAIDRETDDLAARLKWARMATRAASHGIADLAPPPGGWPSGRSQQRPRDTVPLPVTPGAQPAYRAPKPAAPKPAASKVAASALPSRPAARVTAKPKSTASARARASASVNQDVAVQRGRRNAARKIAAVLGAMK